MAQESSRAGNAAVISAIAGIVGALIGGATTGVLTYVTSDHAIKSNAKQDQADFIRNQRLTVYARVSTDNASTASDERALINQMNARTVDSAALTRDQRALAAAIGNMRNDSFSIQLLGSAPAADAVNRLVADHQGYYESVAQQVERLHPSKSRTSAWGTRTPTTPSSCRRSPKTWPRS